MGSYHLNMNVTHYLNMKVMCVDNTNKIQYPCLNNTNKHMTFVSKQCTRHQCSNNTNSWMTSVSIPYEPMKNKFCMIIIAELWPMKFVIWGATWPSFGTNLGVKMKVNEPMCLLEIKDYYLFEVFCQNKIKLYKEIFEINHL
jgi:hypothetical protein